MTINRKTLISILAANAVVAIGCIAGMGWMYHAVRAYERANNVSILSPGCDKTARNSSRGKGGERAVRKTSGKHPLAGKLTHRVMEGEDVVSIAIAYGVSPSQIIAVNDLAEPDAIRPGDVLTLPAGATPPNGFASGRGALPDGASVAISADTNAVARAPQQMKVVNVSYDGETKLDVQLAERPEMDVVRRYVRVAPMDEGTVSFRYSAKYNHRTDAFEPHLIVTGDFAFRTNITMVIRKGLPIYGKGLNPAAPGSLSCLVFRMTSCILSWFLAA